VALALALGLPLLLWAFSWALAWLVTVVNPPLAAEYLASQGMSGFGSYFAAATARRLASIGGLLTLIALLFSALLVLTALPAREEEAGSTDTEGRKATDLLGSEPVRFAAILIAVGALLVLAPEFVYLRDQFGWRMNTVFKFYYQAWMLWSLAAAFGTALLLRSLRGVMDWGFRALIFVVLVISLTYPVLAFANKTNNFAPPYGFTLDDFDRVRRENPDEAGAIEYLRKAPDGILAEAVGGSYTGFARISTYTGLPTVLGWPGHEIQWRGTVAPQGTRQDDIAALYSTADWGTAQAIIQKYQIRYIVVGGLERQAYKVQEEKFRSHLSTVYQTGTISIYEAP
jgi:uncharacterized membrane protein